MRDLEDGGGAKECWTKGTRHCNVNKELCGTRVLDNGIEILGGLHPKKKTWIYFCIHVK